MIKPNTPQNEKQRLAAVKSYQLLDTLPERSFDNITTLTASIFDVPISLITLLDSKRNFLKSHYGLSITESPRETSFCGHAILDDSDLFVVSDARKDPRFQENPFIAEMQIVFYAGARLVNPEGHSLGTLCIFDSKPRTFSAKQRRILTSLAFQVVNLFEAQKHNRTLMRVQEELEERNKELKSFAGIVSHDMKMPLANMVITSDMLRTKYGELLDDQAQQYLDYIKQSSFTLSEYISRLLEHYETHKTASEIAEVFDSHEFLENIIELLNINIDCDINLPEKNVEIHANRNALEQIILNLVVNSIKYNDKEKIKIDIDCYEKDDYYYFSIVDNGMGISKKDMPHIFDLFGKTGVLDRTGKTGNGIGLSTVKKLISKLDGEIKVSSNLGVGTTIKFRVRKNDSVI